MRAYRMNMGNHVKRVALVAAGVLLLAAGAALLVLPGPGLLLVLAGLIVLSTVFPRLERHLEPVRNKAMRAAEESVASPVRVAGSLLAGGVLIGAGVVWTVRPELPLGGWPTGSGLIISGIVLYVLLAYSYRQVRERRIAGRP
jgi:Putative transmembrane protein (PGPGW)